MTTMPRYRGVEQILQRLDAVRLRRLGMELTKGVLCLIAAVAVTLLAAGAMLGYWPGQPPTALRVVLLTVSGAAWLAAVAALLWRLRAWWQQPAQVARAVELALPEARNDLINAILLSSDDQQSSPELVQRAIDESTQHADRLDLRRSVRLAEAKRWALTAGLAALAVLALATLQPGAFGRGVAAMLSPTDYVPSVNALALVGEVTPGDATVFAGERVTVSARVGNEDARPLDAEVLIDGEPTPRAMLAGRGNTEFTCPLGPVGETLRYAVRIDGSRWPADKPFYTLRVVQRVDVEGLDVHYAYPAYTGLEPRTIRNTDGNLEAPLGTTASITVRTSEPVPAAVIEVAGAASQMMTASSEGDTFTGAITVRGDGSYRILLKDTAGATIQQLPDPEGMVEAGAAGDASAGGYRIRAIADEPPRVRFTAPGRDVTLAPGGDLKMSLRATDDYGLTRVALHAGREGEPDEVVRSWKLDGTLSRAIEHTFRLGEQYFEGDTVVYFAEVTDNREIQLLSAGRQTARSGTFKISVRDPQQVAKAKRERFEQLFRRLSAILRMQEKQRVLCETCLRERDALAEVRSAGEQMHAGQEQIRADLADLAKSFPFEPEMASVEQAVGMLAANDAPLAVDQAQVVATLPSLAERRTACGTLAATQDRILRALQTLLAVTASLRGESAAEADASAGGGDLPADASEQLRELRQKLDEFIEQQRKVVEATQMLAKKPVDELTDEDRQLLHELEATEDKWEKFLEEAVTDLSKLAQQDFSSPVVLQELIAVKSDVTMARDALSQGAKETATTFESNGVEDAERLSANVEKWLPDAPDRTQWSMEDLAGGQTNPEQPELPTQLTDLVGDLLEEEEDLFEEMQDLSSTYTSSGDEGIGWQADDGPISNMNAQGVTGNQLPNQNELQGRSGEGRQGKASGEFVEPEAVGKGGRRTPSRLTPEPFQEGEVKDVSTEPPGGATGGGKVSGAGTEGLEGPVPPPITRELPRLARRQAALVNRAERIQAQFDVGDYSNFELLRAITLMKRVQSDLESYRYWNALRARDETLGGLRQTKLLLSGAIDVTADTSQSMPKTVRDDIADAMQGKLPDEYEGALREYYRRLSEGAE
jgi:hypothetical protein